MKKILAKVAVIVLIVFLPILVLSTATEYFTFNDAYYMNEFEKFEILEYTGIEEVDMERIVAKLTGYLKDTEEDLIIYDLFGTGQNRQVISRVAIELRESLFGISRSLSRLCCRMRFSSNDEWIE